MTKLIKFYDDVQFLPLNVERVKNIKDNMITSSGGKRALRMDIAATHAGIIINNRFYLPEKMKQGVNSFIDQYPKPVLLHHDDLQDPVGRIIVAEYVDTSMESVNLMLQNTKTNVTYGEQFIQDFCGAKEGSFIQGVNFICDAFNKTGSLLDDPNYQGLGFAKLTLEITDPDAIEKVLDGRYLTGSVGASTNHAVCSICKQDWADSEGVCEHQPGAMYDDQKAYLITGDLTYAEWSFVNRPADPHSKVMTIYNNGKEEDITFTNSFGPEMTATIELRDSKEENNMTKIDFINKVVDPLRDKLTVLTKEYFDKFTEVNLFADFEYTEEVAETHDLEGAVLLQIHLDAVPLIMGLNSKDEQVAMLNVLYPSMDKDAILKVLEGTFEDATKLIEALDAIEWADYSELEDEELIKWADENLGDAKLSTAQRKKLPGSAFCGPNKSFPVPDCAHVTAARRLIGKASASASTKAKILACVSRKAKAMSCGVSDAVQEEIKVENTAVEPVASLLSIANATNKVLFTIDANGNVVLGQDVSVTDATKTFLEGVSQTFKDALNKAVEFEAQVKVAQDACNVLAQEIEQLRNENKTLTKDLKEVREEFATIHSDLMLITEELVKVRENHQDALADQVCLYKSFIGEAITDKDAFKKELMASGEESIKNTLNILNSKLDVQKIIDTINTGLTRANVDQVEDPTMQLEGQISKETIQKVKQEHERIFFNGASAWGSGPNAARRYLDNLIKTGRVPADVLNQ